MRLEKSNTCYKNDEIVYEILDNFILCPTCVSRQVEINYTKDKNKSSKKNKNCFICHGFLSRISYIVSDIISKIKKYEFENWLLGVKLPTFMYENEDEVRSRFKIRGKKSIKADFLDRLRKEVFIKIKKPQVFKRPDLVINLEIHDNDSLDISIKPRPLVLFGRYVKRIPGIEQKIRNNEKNSELHTNTKYDSCNSDKKHVSIEKIIQEKLSIFCIDKKKDEITIFWIGGEDKESLVVGKGRPFIAQIHNPKKRFLSINDNVHNKDKKQLRTKGISIFIDKILDRMPESKISFLNKIRIYVQCEESISKNEIAKLRILKEKEIITNYKSKQITKKIYSIKSKYLDSNRFVLTIVSDGGLFIKQFIGDISSLMKPNVSEILGKTCTCLKFDILDVDLVSIFI